MDNGHRFCTAHCSDYRAVEPFVQHPDGTTGMRGLHSSGIDVGDGRTHRDGQWYGRRQVRRVRAEGSPGPDGKGAAGGRLHRLPGVSGDGLHRPLRIYHPESDKSRGESRLHRPEDDPCLRRRDLYGRWRILQLP